MSALEQAMQKVMDLRLAKAPKVQVVAAMAEAEKLAPEGSFARRSLSAQIKTVKREQRAEARSAKSSGGGGGGGDQPRDENGRWV